MIGAAIYNLPEDKLPFSSTEKELSEFRSLTEASRRDYLVRNRFAYVYYTGNDTPEWAQGTRVLSRAKDWFVVYAIGDGRSPAVAPDY